MKRSSTTDIEAEAVASAKNVRLDPYLAKSQENSSITTNVFSILPIFHVVDH